MSTSMHHCMCECVFSVCMNCVYWCVGVCVHVYCGFSVWIFVHITCIGFCLSLLTHISMCMYICVQCVYGCVHMCIGICVCMYKCVCVFVFSVCINMNVSMLYQLEYLYMCINMYLFSAYMNMSVYILGCMSMWICITLYQWVCECVSVCVTVSIYVCVCLRADVLECIMRRPCVCFHWCFEALSWPVDSYVHVCYTRCCSSIHSSCPWPRPSLTGSLGFTELMWSGCCLRESSCWE